MISWELVEAGYDAWRTAAPPEPDYDYDEYCEYVDQHPDAGYKAESVADYERWADMMQQEDETARGEVAAERAEADQKDDDEAYWGGL